MQKLFLFQSQRLFVDYLDQWKAVDDVGDDDADDDVDASFRVGDSLARSVAAADVVSVSAVLLCIVSSEIVCVANFITSVNLRV